MAGPNILSWDRSLDLSPYSSDFDVVPRRGIETRDGMIQAQVVVEEAGSDELMITEHPVEQGAVIADHAFKRPSELSVRMGWTNAYLTTSPGGGVGPVAAVYDQILRLQASRLPFTVYTGKRVYYNMLVQGLRNTTNQQTEWAFIAEIHFREIVLVGTSVHAAAGLMAGNTANLAAPEANQPSFEAGEFRPTPAALPPSQIAASIGEGEAGFLEPPPPNIEGRLRQGRMR